MNRQAVFDKVSKHLLEQNEVSVTPRELCSYRYVKEDGKVLKCAIGCLIPDELYNEEMEERLISEIELNSIIEYLEVTTVGEIEFLKNLQEIHDNYLPHQWRHRLEVFAGKYRLKTYIFSN